MARVELVHAEDDVGGDEQQQPGAEEVPREAVRPEVAPSAGEDGQRAGAGDDRVEDGLRLRRQEEVEADRAETGRDERGGKGGRTGPGRERGQAREGVRGGLDDVLPGSA